MKSGKHIGLLLAALCLVALTLSLLRESETPIPSTSPTTSPSSSPPSKPGVPSPLPSTTPIPREFFPTPDPSKPRLGPPEVIDDAKAPQWLFKRSSHEDEAFTRRRERPIWLFQENPRRVMPQDEGLAFCVLSQEYGDVRDGTHEILSEELGSGYRHQLIINGDPSKEAKMLELETDKSRFELTIAVGEYRPPRWRETMKQRLAQELGLDINQIELVVAPEKKTGTTDWVEGEG